MTPVMVEITDELQKAQKEVEHLNRKINRLLGRNTTMWGALDLIWRKMHACNRETIPRRVRDDVKSVAAKALGEKRK